MCSRICSTATTFGTYVNVHVDQFFKFFPKKILWWPLMTIDDHARVHWRWMCDVTRSLRYGEERWWKIFCTVIATLNAILLEANEVDWEQEWCETDDWDRVVRMHSGPVWERWVLKPEDRTTQAMANMWIVFMICTITLLLSALNVLRVTSSITC